MYIEVSGDTYTYKLIFNHYILGKGGDCFLEITFKIFLACDFVK